MDPHRATHEMDPQLGSGQLENQVFESDGIVVTHYPLMFARQHQLQLAPRQFDERAFGLGRLDCEAAIEVGDEVLLEIVVSRGVIVNAMRPEFLRQPPPGWWRRSARCGRGLAVNGPGI
jgi:hypothetical protein